MRIYPVICHVQICEVSISHYKNNSWKEIIIITIQKIVPQKICPDSLVGMWRGFGIHPGFLELSKKCV
jgi:hypothetical protein